MDDESYADKIGDVIKRKCAAHTNTTNSPGADKRLACIHNPHLRYAMANRQTERRQSWCETWHFNFFENKKKKKMESKRNLESIRNKKWKKANAICVEWRILHQCTHVPLEFDSIQNINGSKLEHWLCMSEVKVRSAALVVMVVRARRSFLASWATFVCDDTICGEEEMYMYIV